MIDSWSIFTKLEYLRYFLRHNDNKYEDLTHNDFTYNINKCDITVNGLYLQLILLINYFYLLK
jgi:hypothetical protein